MIQVGGYEPCTVTDFEVPKQFGLRQTIADTLGIGGIMRGLRTIPVMLDMCADMEDAVPRRVVPQLHEPDGDQLPRDRAGEQHPHGRPVPQRAGHRVRAVAWISASRTSEIDYLAAGINHMAFYLRFERDGEDLYPRLRELARVGRGSRGQPRALRGAEALRLLRHRVERALRRVRAVVHQARPARARSTSSTSRSTSTRAAASTRSPAGTPSARGSNAATRSRCSRSFEYASTIIRSIETGKPRVVYGNVPNDGLIDDLPAGCTVEVPCLVDGNGVQPTHIGALPPQLAALIRTNVNVQELTVEAALTGRREHVYHAAMLDPHTAAELDLDQIHALVDALLDAHGDWVPTRSFP